MKVTDITRKALRIRRESRAMQAAGYRQCEPFWELNRGGRFNDVITDVQISACGKYLWAKAGPPQLSN